LAISPFLSCIIERKTAKGPEIFAKKKLLFDRLSIGSWYRSVSRFHDTATRHGESVHNEVNGRGLQNFAADHTELHKLFEREKNTVSNLCTQIVHQLKIISKTIVSSWF
jgi:hypothetical protein